MNSITSRLPFSGITAWQFLRIVIASASRRPCRTCLSMYVGAGRNRLGQICHQQLAPRGNLFAREALLRCLHARLEINEHTSKMGMEFQYCKNKCAPAPSKIGDHVRP